MADEQKSPDDSGEPQVDIDLPLPSQLVEPKTEKKAKKPADGPWWQRLRGWYTSHKKLSIPLSLLILFLLLMVLPFTRYSLAGIAVKKNFTLQVIDSTTSVPVSGATVSSGTAIAQTDGNGKTSLRLSVGKHEVKVAKKYYKDGEISVLVPILKSKSPPEVKLQATGRQVKISVKNSISKEALADVDIEVLDISAKTDKEGNALVVLPAGTATQKASLSLKGYNDVEVEVKVDDKTVAENDLSLTPAGKIYFLSKLSGKIDVVKSNLDGTQREIVLAGTGKEENAKTVLLASRDWKYLALLSRRDSDQAKLYLIETSTDKVTAFDEGNAGFSLLGWSDNNFVYQVNRNGYQPWQPKQQALKSFDAANKKITLLDETDAKGSSNQDYSTENFGTPYLVGQRVVYSKFWSPTFSDASVVNELKLGIYSIAAAGGNRDTHKTFTYDVDEITYEQSFLYNPNQVYFGVAEKGAELKYFVFANNQVNEDSSIKEEFIEYLNNSQILTYLQSPAGSATFWNESRDGKKSLFVGDQSGSNAKQIASLSDYQAYGWYTNNYLLVSKNDSELYILSKDGIKKDSEALKISDYHKPVLTYSGYGGGYGGL